MLQASTDLPDDKETLTSDILSCFRYSFFRRLSENGFQCSQQDRAFCNGLASWARLALRDLVASLALASAYVSRRSGRRVLATYLRVGRRRTGQEVNTDKQIILNAPPTLHARSTSLGPQPCCKTHATASTPNLGNLFEPDVFRVSSVEEHLPTLVILTCRHVTEPAQYREAHTRQKVMVSPLTAIE